MSQVSKDLKTFASILPDILLDSFTKAAITTAAIFLVLFIMVCIEFHEDTVFYVKALFILMAASLVTDILSCGFRWLIGVVLDLRPFPNLAGYLEMMRNKAESSGKNG